LRNPGIPPFSPERRTVCVASMIGSRAR